VRGVEVRQDEDAHDAAETSEALPVVDVGVVTWNTRELTVRALRHLLDTDQGVRLRLLVYDNASSDGTPEAIARDVPEADLSRGDANLGFAAAVNQLVERSGTPWFLALNSDAWPEPGAIGRMLATGEQTPAVAAVAPRLLRPEGSLEHSTHPFPGLAVALVTGLGLPAPRWWRREHALHGAWEHDEQRFVDWAVGAALLLRRKAIDEIGLLDDSTFMYGEDLEWCWRAHGAGWRVLFEPAAVVRHVGNASGERAWGSRRDAVIWAQSYAIYRREHGPVATAAFRAANQAGAVRAWLRAGRREGRAGLRAALAPHRPSVDAMRAARPDP
jgi:GT2 family glycosyltransferase